MELERTDVVSYKARLLNARESCCQCTSGSWRRFTPHSPLRLQSELLQGCRLTQGPNYILSFEVVADFQAIFPLAVIALTVSYT